MDAITVLKHDHEEVEKLFRSYEKLGKGAQDARTKKKIVSQIVRLLSIHAAAEEQTLYPMTRSKLAKNGARGQRNGASTVELVLRFLEDHHVMKVLLAELEDMKPTDERYDAKMAVLARCFRDHISDEESKLFPMVKKAFSRMEIENMGKLIARIEKIAPTRPHPGAPDTPPRNILATMPVTVIDRARDAGAALLERVAGSNGKHGRSVRGQARTKAAATKRQVTRRANGARRGRAHAHR